MGQLCGSALCQSSFSHSVPPTSPFWGREVLPVPVFCLHRLPLPGTLANACEPGPPCTAVGPHIRVPPSGASPAVSPLPPLWDEPTWVWVQPDQGAAFCCPSLLPLPVCHLPFPGQRRVGEARRWLCALGHRCCCHPGQRGAVAEPHNSLRCVGWACSPDTCGMSPYLHLGWQGGRGAQAEVWAQPRPDGSLWPLCRRCTRC